MNNEMLLAFTMFVLIENCGRCVGETKNGVKLTLVRTEITRNTSTDARQDIVTNNANLVAINNLMPQSPENLNQSLSKAESFVKPKNNNTENATNFINNTTKFLNQTILKPPNVNLNKEKTQNDKGAKRTDVYQVNNGMLLSRPKKLVTITGIKKSFQALPPTSINYHLIKKSNVSVVDDDMMTNNPSKELLLGMTHLRRRSLIEQNTNVPVDAANLVQDNILDGKSRNEIERHDLRETKDNRNTFETRLLRKENIARIPEGYQDIFKRTRIKPHLTKSNGVQNNYNSPKHKTKLGSSNPLPPLVSDVPVRNDVPNRTPCIIIVNNLSGHRINDKYIMKKCRQHLQTSYDIKFNRKNVIQKLKDRQTISLSTNQRYDRHKKRQKFKRKYQENRAVLSRTHDDENKPINHRTIQSNLHKNGLSRRGKSDISKIEPIEDIDNDFDELKAIMQYRRFPIRNFMGNTYPRFRENDLKLIEFPRFPISRGALKEFPQASISKSAPKDLKLIEFPRFPISNAALPEFHEASISKSALKEYPRTPEVQSLFKEFPRFPAALKRYPEPPGIPEIMPLRAKRNEIRAHGSYDHDNIPFSKHYNYYSDFNEAILKPLQYRKRDQIYQRSNYGHTNRQFSKRYLKRVRIVPRNYYDYHHNYNKPIFNAIRKIYSQENTKRNGVDHGINLDEYKINFNERFLQRNAIRKSGNRKRNRVYSNDYDEPEDDYDNSYQPDYKNRDDIEEIGQLAINRRSDPYSNYEPINGITKIHHISAPPAIPSIPDIPEIAGLPSIPFIKEIPSLPSLKPIKPIPPAQPLRDGKSVTTSPKNLAVVDSQPVPNSGQRSQKADKDQIISMP